MRWKHLLLVGLLGSALATQAATARVIKVLPHFLDLEGRQSLNPSLFERDAYQALLQKKPAQRSALRFDIQWKGAAKGDYLLRLEARGGLPNGQITRTQLETKVRQSGPFSKWGTITLQGQEYKDFGDLAAWRVTLWEGDKLVGEQKSFLW